MSVEATAAKYRDMQEVRPGYSPSPPASATPKVTAPENVTVRRSSCVCVLHQIGLTLVHTNGGGM